MDKTIDLLKQAQANIKVMLEDFTAIAAKSKEIVTLLSKHVGKDQQTISDLTSLSEREREIFVLVGQEMSRQEIAGKLGISVKTVDATKSKILKKLHIDNFYELKKRAEAEK